MEAPPPPGPDSAAGRPALPAQGPLTREQAAAVLDIAAGRVAAGEFGQALALYQRVVGHRDADVTAAALLGTGEAWYRLDHEDAAVESWSAVLQLPETPSTYPAIRNLAAAKVRAGDLRGALTLYREAERRAPPEDRAEIASRLGWLTKELGDTRASRRYFARARGDGLAAPVTVAIILVTSAISLAAMFGSGADVLLQALWLDKDAVAAGEYWRLWTVTLVHANLLHLAFNMYALWLVGPIVERFYGAVVYLVMYLLCAAAGSIASFVFGPDVPSVGASGAIFGLFGVLLAASRVHDPIVDRRTRGLLVQIGPLILINLVFGFVSGFVDNAAHIGGLLAGIWLGALMVPSRVETLGGRWQRPGGAAVEGWRGSLAIRLAAVLALVVVLAAGVALGTQARTGGPAGTEARIGGVELRSGSGPGAG